MDGQPDNWKSSLACTLKLNAMFLVRGAIGVSQQKSFLFPSQSARSRGSYSATAELDFGAKVGKG